LFVGQMTDQPVGPHPMAQFEAHFLEQSVPSVVHDQCLRAARAHPPAHR
jgi:aromatic ring-cleaving dioxygenase